MALRDQKALKGHCTASCQSSRGTQSGQADKHLAAARVWRRLLKLALSLSDVRCGKSPPTRLDDGKTSFCRKKILNVLGCFRLDFFDFIGIRNISKP